MARLPDVAILVQVVARGRAARVVVEHEAHRTCLMRTHTTHARWYCAVRYRTAHRRPLFSSVAAKTVSDASQMDSSSGPVAQSSSAAPLVVLEEIFPSRLVVK